MRITTYNILHHAQFSFDFSRAAPKPPIQTQNKTQPQTQIQNVITLPLILNPNPNPNPNPNQLEEGRPCAERGNEKPTVRITDRKSETIMNRSTVLS